MTSTAGFGISGWNSSTVSDDIGDLDTVVSTALSAALFFIFLFGCTANVILLVLFYRRPSLRSISNR